MTNNAFGLAYVRDDLGVPVERIIVAPYLTSEPGTSCGAEGRATARGSKRPGGLCLREFNTTPKGTHPSP